VYGAFFKPLFDRSVSLVILIVLSPALAVISVLVFVSLGSPVLFSQVRPGRHEKLFKLYKFRSMTRELDREGNLLPDAERLTCIGKFLRKTSLDELPQFFNVLKGDISIVGPRPLLVEYIPLYSGEQRKRHDVRPGITGLAQINGRNAITWEEKFKLDVYYVNHLSFTLDMSILFRTVVMVLRGKGIYNNDGATMDKFTGSRV
jgi:undecaprenyl phosphate N,N'-diacetylbacillosamine 1-phosphate transferase